MAEAVHGAGGKIMPQLWHVGLGRMPEYAENPDEQNVGPTDRYPLCAAETKSATGAAA